MGALSFAFAAVMFTIELGHYPNANVGGLTLQDAYEFKRLFPEHVARDMLKIGRYHSECHSDFILREYGVFPHLAWAKEVSICTSAWEALHDLHTSIFSDPWYILVYLGRIRDAIGADAYDARMMPPPCPGWMFRPE